MPPSRAVITGINRHPDLPKGLNQVRRETFSEYDVRTGHEGKGLPDKPVDEAIRNSVSDWFADKGDHLRAGLVARAYNPYAEGHDAVSGFPEHFGVVRAKLGGVKMSLSPGVWSKSGNGTREWGKDAGPLIHMEHEFPGGRRYVTHSKFNDLADVHSFLHQHLARKDATRLMEWIKYHRDYQFSGDHERG